MDSATALALSIAPLSGDRMKSGFTFSCKCAAISGIAEVNATGIGISSRAAGACKSNTTIPSQWDASNFPIALALIASPGRNLLSCREYPKYGIATITPGPTDSID